MDATTIELETQKIEAALGHYLCSADQPCAAAVYYDEGEEKPWRIADDGASESFGTVEEAIEGAHSWAEAMSSEGAECCYCSHWNNNVATGIAHTCTRCGETFTASEA